MYKLLVILHLLGATVWVGGHLVLAATVLPKALAARDPQVLLGFEGGFEKLGMPALAIQILTGFTLVHWWFPDLSAALAVHDPRLPWVGVKLALLLATVGLALNARLRLIPRLTAATLPLLGWHVRAVTVFAVLFLVAGAAIRTGGLP
jgi:putative copper export protein